MSQPQQSSWAKAADGLQRVVFLFAALMDRLRYATKFMVIGGIVAVPFFALLWLQSAATSERITFADNERNGIEYIMAAKDFYTQVQRRRVLAVAEVGLEDTSYRGEIAEATKQADAAAEKLAKLDKDVGEDLRTTSRWTSVKADWDKLKKESARTVIDADRGHAKVALGVQELMQAYAATASNLPIDPDSSVSRLLNDFLVGMTLRMDTVARTAFIGLTPAPDTTNQTERNFELTQLSSRLGKMPEEVRTRTIRQTVESEDAEDKSKLGVQRQKLDGQLKTFGESLRRRFFSGSVATLEKSEGKAFTSEAVAALNAGQAYWKAVGDELEDSVTSRLRGAQSVRLVATIVGTATVLLLVFLFLGFYASVRRSIDALRVATGRMISGTTETFQLQARDELAEIALAYNEINGALSEARELRTRVAHDNEALQENILVMLETVAHAAEGDLSKKVPVTAGALGNVADAINAMFESFSGLVEKITEAANRVLREAREIQQNSDALTSGSTRQLDNIVSATTSIQEMSTTLSRAATSAEVTLEAAENSLKQAASSRDEVVRVVEGMRSIQKTATETLTQLKTLGERTDAITDIVNTITRIAEQSNRLALNAAIEASRAGEHGRGFAVVANEVRRLAERSAEAASEITTVVSTIQNEASQSVRAMSDATRNVEGQLRSAESATKTLEELARFSRQVSDAIQQINVTAKQQVKGATDVVKTMDVVSNVSKQAVQRVEQTSLTTRRLVELSTELNSAVQQFRV